MASDFVRNIKGVRNINKLSTNITTENDLISTIDGEVYVVTKKGYKNITNVETQDFDKLKTKVENLKNQSENNTTDIGTLKTDVSNNTTDIGTLKTDVSNNTSEIDGLQTDVSNNTSEIETLKTTTGNNTSEIKGVKSEQTKVKNSVTDLETSTSNLSKKFDGLNSNTIVHDEDILNFQKYKLTSDNGKLPITNLENSYDKLNGLANGLHYVSSVPDAVKNRASSSGYLLILEREDVGYKKQIHISYNNGGIIQRYYDGDKNTWSEWNRILTTQEYDKLQKQIDDIKSKLPS